ncbi:hypothetical protein AYI69_g10147, partial [Smittium culicis]
AVSLNDGIDGGLDAKALPPQSIQSHVNEIHNFVSLKITSLEDKIKTLITKGDSSKSDSYSSDSVSKDDFEKLSKNHSDLSQDLAAKFSSISTKSDSTAAELGKVKKSLETTSSSISDLTSNLAKQKDITLQNKGDISKASSSIAALTTRLEKAEKVIADLTSTQKSRDMDSIISAKFVELEKKFTDRVTKLETDNINLARKIVELKNYIDELTVEE